MSDDPAKLLPIAEAVHDLVEEATGQRHPFILIVLDGQDAYRTYVGEREDYVQPLNRMLRAWARERKKAKRLARH